MQEEIDYYTELLKTIDYLFELSGEEFWKNEVTIALNEYGEEKSTSRFLKAFQGMKGSRELTLKPEEENSISKDSAKNCNRILNIVLDLALECAHKIQEEKEITYNVLENKIEEEIEKLEIQGWKCISCGARFIKKDSLQDYLIFRNLSKLILSYLKNRKLDNLIDLTLHNNIPTMSEEEGVVLNFLDENLIITVSENLWSCKKCIDGKIDKCIFKINGLNKLNLIEK